MQGRFHMESLHAGLPGAEPGSVLSESDYSTPSEWRKLFKRISYRHGVTFRVIPGNHTYGVFAICVQTVDSRSDSTNLITIVHQTALYPEIGDEKHRMAFIRHCVQAMEAHESDEWLKLDGEMLNDPHAPGAFR